MKELKKYAIQSSTRPSKNPLLSTAVVVRNEAGETGYCYIRFAPEFVTAVAKQMPRGLIAGDPAFLSVRYYAPTKIWLVIAQYVCGGGEYLLWSSGQKPSWLNFHKVKHGNHPKKARSSASAAAGPRSTRAGASSPGRPDSEACPATGTGGACVGGQGRGTEL